MLQVVILMNVVYALVTIPAVQIVQVYPMVIAGKVIVAAYQIIIQVMIVMTVQG